MLAVAAAKSLQLCPTLCDPIDGSPPGTSIPVILQARTLEWVAISFSNAWKWKVKVKSLSCVRVLATPWTAAHQAPPSMGFSRQEYWSRLPFPSPGDLPEPGIKPGSPALQADALPSEPPGRRTSLILDNSLLLLPSLSLLILIVNMMMVFSFTYREFGKLSSGHRTGKGQFSFQFQRKAMPKNAQTTAQLHSSHKLVK